MPTSRGFSPLIIAVVLAVVAIVVAATSAVGWAGRGSPSPDPLAAASPPTKPSRVIDPFASAAPGSTARRVPDTSVVALDSRLHHATGRLVAHGKEFRIERVKLGAPVSATLHGHTFTAHTVLRITISAGPYVVRDMPDIVSVDGTPLAVGMESRDLSSLMAFTFDRSVRAPGAQLRVSYGLPSQSSVVWSSVVRAVR